MILSSSFHTPVLLSQVIDSLRVRPGKKYIDATLGGGGYAFELLKLGGVVLGIDRDKEAINYVKEKKEDRRWKVEERKNLYLAHGNFADLKEIAHSNGFDEVAGIIFDLGMSSYQLENSGRGFSYTRDEPLDMRMDVWQKLTAADVINNFSQVQLYEIFTKYAEELYSRPISEAIVRARSLSGEIKKTSELTKLIDEVVERVYSKDSNLNKFKSRTKARIFQALRISVNDELANLQKGLTDAIDLLAKEARLAVLSYHSLEDRIVKLTFKRAEGVGKLKIVTANVMTAKREELAQNPKAGSAKLRIGQKV